MAKRVILAVAGAGKTYFLCHKIDPNKRNLILAFTHENINNVQHELYKAYGRLPELTTVTTFDSFVYHELILPYEPSIAEYFGHPEFISNGICTIDPPSKTIKNKFGKSKPNPLYTAKNELNHYITHNQQYYCATLSELVMQIKQNRETLVNRVAKRLNLFYDCILIDEFQDFREYDYDLIMALVKRLNDITLVGDYYQHSVSGTNNSGKPYKCKTKEISYADFLNALQSTGVDVDTTTLEKSRRCSTEICEYVCKKLNIQIASCSENNGAVVWIDDEAERIINDNSVTKLVYKDAAKCLFNAMNWSYSKGSTLNAVCVILTDDFEELQKDSFSTERISKSTINKLYVAMTRSCGNLYLIKSSTFKRLKHKFIKNN